MALTPGSSLGPYEVTALLGEGGMGQVYRATDSNLKRSVAIKVLPASVAGDADRLARFQREAEVLAALNHPNIAGIYGLEKTPDFTALVMELVDGDDLSQRIAKGAIPLDEALPIAKQIAEALEAAHEQGIIHRDLKPANIKVRSDGAVKVLDFGLAKAMDPAGGSSANAMNSPTLSMHATQAGIILGTAAYMSPEQASGKLVDKRADVWSFGVVLLEMLTGQRLFDGETISHTLADVLRGPIDFTRLPAGTPRAMRDLLRRCLHRDVKKRLRDMGEARIAIEDALSGTAPEEMSAAALPAPAAPRSLVTRALPWALVATSTVALIALAVVSVVHLREQPVERQLLQYTMAAPDKTTVQALAISPDGHYLVMQATGNGGQQLWVRSLDSLQAQPLAGTDGASFPFWSPDSRYIGFFTGTQLKKIAVAGGPAQALCDAPFGRGGTWSGDGVIVFAANNGNGGLSRVAATGGVPALVTKNEAGGSHRWPLFLPDGRRFLYLASAGKVPGIHLGSLDTGNDRRLVLDESNPQYVPPSPGNPFGHLLFVRQQTLMVQPVDAQTLEPKGDLFPAAERVAVGLSAGNNLYSVSRNGLLVLQTGSGSGRRGGQFAWFDRTGKEIGRVGTADLRRPALKLSPDGARFVVERLVGDGTGNTDLWITDMAHDATETRLTFDASSNIDAVWSPDGRSVAFSSSRKRAYNLYLRASNGTGQDEVLLESGEPKYPTDWSRDGRFLVFEQQEGGLPNEDLWALPLAGDKKPIPLLRTPYRETQGQVSPDGRWLAYTSNESGQPQVYVQPFAPGWERPMTGKWQVSTTGGAQPRWRGDGKEIFYFAADRKLMAVDVKATAQSFDRGTPQALFESRTGGVFSPFAMTYAVSADGKRFLMMTAPLVAGEAPLTVVVNWLAGVKK